MNNQIRNVDDDINPVGKRDFMHMQNCACTTFRNPITISDVYRVKDFVVGSGGKSHIWFDLNISVGNITISV